MSGGTAKAAARAQMLAVGLGVGGAGARSEAGSVRFGSSARVRSVPGFAVQQSGLSTFANRVVSA